MEDTWLIAQNTKKVIGRTWIGIGIKLQDQLIPINWKLIKGIPKPIPNGKMGGMMHPLMFEKHIC